RAPAWTRSPGACVSRSAASGSPTLARGHRRPATPTSDAHRAPADPRGAVPAEVLTEKLVTIKSQATEDVMTPLQIFGLQFLLSLVLYTVIARWHVAPRLAALPLASALSPLLFLHAFRHLGMVFLVPTVVGSSLPPAFAVPAAYGDLLAALLALLAIVALRSRWPFGLPLVWLFNVVGTVDLVNALAQGLARREPGRGVLHPDVRGAGSLRHARDDLRDARPTRALRSPR